MAVDPEKEYADFLEKRQAKIDAKKEKARVDERDTIYSQFSNPPSVRATDGGEPGTKERHPLEVAAEADAEADSDEDADNVIPTKANKVDEIKAYLDAQGISYDGVTKKDDLLALIPADTNDPAE